VSRRKLWAVVATLIAISIASALIALFLLANIELDLGAAYFSGEDLRHLKKTLDRIYEMVALSCLAAACLTGAVMVIRRDATRMNNPNA
jgi:hypothetical protein